jgi:hypothetical protein
MSAPRAVVACAVAAVVEHDRALRAELVTNELRLHVDAAESFVRIPRRLEIPDPERRVLLDPEADRREVALRVRHDFADDPRRTAMTGIDEDTVAIAERRLDRTDRDTGRGRQRRLLEGSHAVSRVAQVSDRLTDIFDLVRERFDDQGLGGLRGDVRQCQR